MELAQGLLLVLRLRREAGLGWTGVGPAGPTRLLRPKMATTGQLAARGRRFAARGRGGGLADGVRGGQVGPAGRGGGPGTGSPARTMPTTGSEDDFRRTARALGGLGATPGTPEARAPGRRPGRLLPPRGRVGRGGAGWVSADGRRVNADVSSNHTWAGTASSALAARWLRGGASGLVGAREEASGGRGEKLLGLLAGFFNVTP